jgi:tetratricopeptide (TPR) repeat protein
VTFNHDEPAVVEYVTRVMNDWLDRGADGWRLDAAYAVPRHCEGLSCRLQHRNCNQSKVGSAFRSRADYLRSAAEFDRAISDYNQAIRLDPQDAAALNGRCRSFALANRELQQALDDCDAALRIAIDPDILNSRGLVNLKRSVFDKAREDYAAAVSARPADADSLTVADLPSGGLETKVPLLQISRQRPR